MPACGTIWESSWRGWAILVAPLRNSRPHCGSSLPTKQRGATWTSSGAGLPIVDDRRGTAPVIYSEMVLRGLPPGATMVRAILTFCLVSAAAHAASQREIAEWVIRWEGRVILEGGRQTIAELS